MSPLAAKVMSTVAAPYGVLISAEELAVRIADTGSAASFDCSVFSFLSEVSPKLQLAFIEQMGVSKEAVALVANQFSDLAGYKLPLAT